MKRVVERERNKIYYRILHLPIWIWVFFILPGHLTFDLYTRGPDRRHAIWLAVVTLVCAWRGIVGRLPGVEQQPYVTYFGVDQPNLPYRVVCYTAAWIALLVPFALNLLGLLLAVATGGWMMDYLYEWLYYPLASAMVVATWLDWTPRARRSTREEGAERAWFYVAVWTVVPAQLVGWALWRLASKFGFSGVALDQLRLAGFLTITLILFSLGITGKLPRTARYYNVAESRGALETEAGGGN